MTINTAELTEAVDTECADEPTAACNHPPSALDFLPPAGILARLPDVSGWSDLTRSSRHAYRKGAIRILDWLMRFEGDGWQARWEAANGNATVWIDQLVAQDPRAASTSRTELVGGLRFLLFLRVFRPSYGFFHSYRASQFYDCAQRSLNPDMFARLDRLGHTLGMPDQQIIDGKRTLVRIMLHTGTALDEITEDDFIELRDYYHLNRSEFIPHGASQAWDLLGAAGILKSTGTLFAAVRRQGQLPTAALVDSYRLRCKPMRDVLVRYLDRRRPGMDYSTFRGLVTTLVKLFWADIEHHHPAINSLHLPPEVAEAGKQRVQTVTERDGSTHPRRGHLAILVRVRAFYLDIQEWALEDASWAEWAVPCPVRRGDTDGMVKQRKSTTAAMHQRVRERLPHLERIVDAADEYRRGTSELRVLATDSEIGDTFTHAGVCYRRLAPNTRQAGRNSNRGAIPLRRLDNGEELDITKDEDDAFWSWAITETLRHTGIRLEELLEITQLALVQYQLPDTGEIVPLLQIVPSKNAEERLLLVSPELASVLATIITRVRKQNNGIIPAISRYDPYERTDGPALPHLFQRRNRWSWRTTVIGLQTVYVLLQSAVDQAGITDNAGEPLRYTPHDFRRMFATEAVTGGLPVHIAAKLLGHATLTTTQHYLAIFQDEVVRAYRSFLDRRRSVRPEAEYREPTEHEWAEFHQHFHERKLELGTCGRPYGTPCQHEHACIRCPMLRVDPKQRARLTEIIRNLNERITEAQMNGWLGEVQGLQTSRDAAAKKLASLDRALARGKQTSGPPNLGIPTITTTSRT